MNLLHEQLELAGRRQHLAAAERARMAKVLRAQRRAVRLQAKAQKAFQRACASAALLSS